MMSINNKTTIVIILMIFVVISYSAEYEKRNCKRPLIFKNTEEIDDYIGCIKTITGTTLYGKRSIQDTSPFHQKLVNNPSFAQIKSNLNDPEYLQELLYQILKDEHEIREESS